MASWQFAALLVLILAFVSMSNAQNITQNENTTVAVIEPTNTMAMASASVHTTVLPTTIAPTTGGAVNMQPALALLLSMVFACFV